MVCQVYVGMKLHMVWGVDSCQRVYVREAIFPELPIGISWVPVPGLNALHLSIRLGCFTLVFELDFRSSA